MANKVLGGFSLALVMLSAMLAPKWAEGSRKVSAMGPQRDVSLNPDDQTAWVDGDDDDDDDSHAGSKAPVVRAAFVELNGSPPLILLVGEHFCETARIEAGAADGTTKELLVFNAAPTFVQAEFPTTQPGTYRIVLSCGGGQDSVDVTIGATGPQGPPGEDALVLGQVCPEGQFAIGFGLDGGLLCSGRPPADGSCPCFSEERRLEATRLIQDLIEGDPDDASLHCVVFGDFIAISLQDSKRQTLVDLFARVDACGYYTSVPGDGTFQTRYGELGPEEAAACNVAIFASARSLGCL